MRSEEERNYYKNLPEGTCICEGNWQSLVCKYDHLIGKKFRDKRTGDIYTFFGLVHGDDDYYYGMCRKYGQGLILSSCVGRLEDSYELVEGTDGQLV